jgi:hypothetical protein
MPLVGTLPIDYTTKELVRKKLNIKDVDNDWNFIHDLSRNLRNYYFRYFYEDEDWYGSCTTTLNNWLESLSNSELKSLVLLITLEK